LPEKGGVRILSRRGSREQAPNQGYEIARPSVGKTNTERDIRVQQEAGALTLNPEAPKSVSSSLRLRIELEKLRNSLMSGRWEWGRKGGGEKGGGGEGGEKEKA